MNHNVLRPIDMQQPLTDYQRAEEMIKEEMLAMLHHDCLSDPTLNQLGPAAKKPTAHANVKPISFEKHQTFLKERGGYNQFSADALAEVSRREWEQM